MAVQAVQVGSDVEVAHRGRRIDIGRRAAGDRPQDLGLRVAKFEDRSGHAVFRPGRPALHVDIGAEAQGIDRRAGSLFEVADAREVQDRDVSRRIVEEAMAAAVDQAVGAAIVLGERRRQPAREGVASFVRW